MNLPFSSIRVSSILFKRAMSSISIPLSLTERPRRNRKNAVLRAMHEETTIGPQHFIYPLFIQEGSSNTPIASLPGCERLCLDGLVKEVGLAREEGIHSVVLFPAVDEKLKTSRGEECYNSDGLVQRALRTLKQEYPDVMLYTDVALDPYNSDGHDGIVSNGEILNDETIEVLCKQAVSQAEAGADVISPSDMMDGRIGAIRLALDHAGFHNVSILAYTAKYASAFYGPFRDALDSKPKFGDKKTYQLNPANAREALREVILDGQEGADMVMIKPAGAYLDIIRTVRDRTLLPVAAYQVSGEYAMLKAAAMQGWIDEKACVLESLLAIRRAGADVILTYYSRQAARWLKEK